MFVFEGSGCGKIFEEVREYEQEWLMGHNFHQGPLLLLRYPGWLQTPHVFDPTAIPRYIITQGQPKEI